MEILRGAWYRSEPIPPPLLLLATTEDCTKGGKVYWKGFQDRESGNTGRFHIPHDFNIVVDAVARTVLDEVCGPQETQHGLGWAVEEENLVFYADGGRIVWWYHK